VQAGRERDALRVISGRSGNHAAPFFIVGQTADFVIRAAHFERAAFLQTFGFQISVTGADYTGEFAVGKRRRRDNDVLENRLRVFDVGKFHGHTCQIICESAVFV
jgi:hypothetical protein